MLLNNIQLWILTITLISSAVAWLVNERQKRQQIKWELKRETCLEALEIVDSHFANQGWSNFDASSIAKQPKPDIQKVRSIHNKLCLVCDKDDVLTAYKQCLGVYGPITMDDIVDMRNAIRRELGFGGIFDKDRDKSWIIYLGALE